MADLVSHQHLSSHGVAESIAAMQALPLIHGALDASMALAWIFEREQASDAERASRLLAA